VTTVTGKNSAPHYTAPNMAAPFFSAGAGEALVLGLATGPVCLASCGPAVLPWILVQPHGVRARARQLIFFLGARLIGYLLFAAAAWFAGAAIARAWSSGVWAAGGIQLLLAVTLVIYAAGWPRPRCAAGRASLVEIGVGPKPRPAGAALLGLLTGINLCPPFVVAGVRAAEAGTLPAALLFFLVFFVGTGIWFVPFFALGWVRRTPSLITVARMAAVLLAWWYAFSGISILIEKAAHG